MVDANTLRDAFSSFAVADVRAAIDNAKRDTGELPATAKVYCRDENRDEFAVAFGEDNICVIDPSPHGTPEDACELCGAPYHYRGPMP